MSTRLGVDLGTTWTAAALASDHGVEPLNLGTHGAAIPSVVAVDGEKVLVGESAERQLLVAPADGAREFKRRLGDETPYLLGGSPYGAEALMGKVLAHVVALATERAGTAPDEVILTHPATWGGYKLDLLKEAGRVAGLDSVTLLGEPQAAALHYVRLGKVQPGDLVAVYDFGGGTFDVAIVRCGDQPELLGTPEGLERLGGIDLDHAVFAHVNDVVGGQLQELDGNDPEVARGVVRLRAACTSAKEALSADNDATIEVLLPGLSTQVRMTRGELEDAVRPRLDDTVAALERALGTAGLSADDLAGVLLVGGSSRIPLVAEHVASRLGRPVLVDADPKLVVALGAAGGASAAGAGAAGDAALAMAGAGAAAAGGGKAGQGAGAAGLKAKPERGASSPPVGAAVAGVAAVGAAAVGAMAATNTGLFADDDPSAKSGDETAAEDSAATEAEADPLADLAPPAESLDAFDAGPSFAGGGGGGGGGGVRVVRSGGGDGGGGGGGRGSRSPDRDIDGPRDMPRDMPRPDAGGTGGMPAGSPDIEATRAQLRDRLGNLARPDGADDKEFAELKQDLDGLIDRYQGIPGQTVDDAVAGLRTQFEDRVRDFAQDQRIEALVEQQQRDEAAQTAVNTEVDTFKATLTERLAAWQPPAGADPAEAAAMRDRLNAMVDRFTPMPGQTAQEALGDLRTRFDDEVGDFAQDLRIDALVADARTDTPTTPPTTETPATGDMPATETPATGDMPATETPATGDMPATETPATETPATGDMPATETPATGEMPATDAPAAETPATETPATQAPATDMPAAEAPATDMPAAEAPATDIPAPAAEAPATEAPATEAPATEAPAAEAPATEAPATEAPAAEAPAPQGVAVGEMDPTAQAATDMPAPQGVAIGEMDPTSRPPAAQSTTMPVDIFEDVVAQADAPAAASEAASGAVAPNPAVTMTSQDLVGDDVTGATGVTTAATEAPMAAPTEAAAEAPRPEVTLPPPTADMGGDDITGAVAATAAADEMSAAVEPEAAAAEAEEPGGSMPEEPDTTAPAAEEPDATRPLPEPEATPEPEPVMAPDSTDFGEAAATDLPDPVPAPDPDVELT